MKVLFDKTSVDWVLNIFDKTIDKNGFIIDNDKNKVLCSKGKEIQKSELLGIKKNKNGGNNESYFAIGMPWS